MRDSQRDIEYVLDTSESTGKTDPYSRVPVLLSDISTPPSATRVPAILSGGGGGRTPYIHTAFRIFVSWTPGCWMLGG